MGNCDVCPDVFRNGNYEVYAECDTDFICPSCGKIWYLLYDEVEDEETGEWDYVYWFEDGND